MKYSIYTLIIFAVFVASCSEQQYFVKGKSTQSTLDGEYAYMAPMTTYSLPYIDSCRVVHGQFEMTGRLDSIQCVTIYMGSTGIPMVLETGEVSINFQNSNIRVSGTPLNDRFYTFLNTRDSLIFIQKELYDRISAMSVYRTFNNYDSDATAIRTVTAEIDSLLVFTHVWRGLVNCRIFLYASQTAEDLQLRTTYFQAKPWNPELPGDV